MKGSIVKNTIVGIVGLILLYLVFWFYSGFFKPDPYALTRYHPLSTGLLWLIRIGIPVFLGGIIILVFRIQRKKTDFASVGILIGILFILSLFLYPIANHLYSKSMSVKNRTAEFHPYLQLTPHTYKPANQDTINIVCLGGSTTEFTDDDGRGWPARVEILLNTSSQSKSARLHNQGRQWYTSLHSLVNYQTNIHQHKPDAILIMHNINDVLHNADFSYFSHQPFRNDYGHFYGPVNRIVLSKSLPGFLKEFVGYLWNHEPRVTVETDVFPGLEPFKQNLTNLILLAQHNHSDVILLTQPSLYQAIITDEIQDVLYMLNNEAIGSDKKWSYQSAYQAMKQYNDAIRNLAVKHHLTLIDLDTIVPKTLDYFYDDVHYRTKAYDLIAQTVARHIESISIKK